MLLLSKQLCSIAMWDMSKQFLTRSHVQMTRRQTIVTRDVLLGKKWDGCCSYQIEEICTHRDKGTQAADKASVKHKGRKLQCVLLNPGVLKNSEKWAVGEKVRQGGCNQAKKRL